MDFNDETVFEKEVVLNILKEVTEETLHDQTYNQGKVGQWISDICERSNKKLVALGKPFKYIVSCVIMQKNGAGMHTCSSCFWDNANDGSASYKSPQDWPLNVVTTCFALAI
mmetsp:Transcript_18533/g.44567  ORF Transcript_18533/g.44567 Transcript_18533/m.44567 type:complete len:112 (+) Transcript_18533:269-604(+)|eukprot:CAMPEP_0177695748 /NCGR_PEP_ID=MMETSP0484_2-20121128/3621_1 /TAXON_ID=354590 /ORGANISM="Rhodomonas lens, Strain RHODO" /LENGTH=111 /DNA_ID=CAMNT_0019206691 /DNA_START=254 /DNA_END=589 /DNA_ORIENTATION=+